MASASISSFAYTLPKFQDFSSLSSSAILSRYPFSSSSNLLSIPSSSTHTKIICNNPSSRPKNLITSSLINNSRTPSRITCRAAEYKFPDPIPEFAEAETEKFKNHLLNKLSKKDYFGDSVEEVVKICTEIFNTFLHTEYGGPGTLLVVPFIDMADTLEERGLPGGPQAARAAVKWAQNHVDKDWKEWNGSS